MGKSEILAIGDVRAVGEYEVGRQPGWGSVITWMLNQETWVFPAALEILWFNTVQVQV